MSSAPWVDPMVTHHGHGSRVESLPSPLGLPYGLLGDVRQYAQEPDHHLGREVEPYATSGLAWHHVHIGDDGHRRYNVCTGSGHNCGENVVDASDKEIIGSAALNWA